MTIDREVSAHYSRGTLLSRLNAALLEDGVDPDHPSIEELAPYDQFHGRGLEATKELAERMPVGFGRSFLFLACCFSEVIAMERITGDVFRRSQFETHPWHSTCCFFRKL